MVLDARDEQVDDQDEALPSLVEPRREPLEQGDKKGGCGRQIGAFEDFEDA